MFPSPSLTAKILSVNFLALIIIVVGVLYIGRYQNNIIQSELDQLQAETQLSASALQESIVANTQNPELRRHKRQAARIDTNINLERARRLVEALAERSNVRIRFYSNDGALITDSRRKGGANNEIEIEPLEPFSQDIKKTQSLYNSLYNYVFNLISFLPVSHDLEVAPYFDRLTGIEIFNLFREKAALLPASIAWNVLDESNNFQKVSQSNNYILLTSFVPVIFDGQKTGYILSQRKGDDIQNAITQIRLEVIQISIFAFGATFLLSLYLAATIGVPLKRLSAAAHDIRHGKQVTEIPSYPKRKDEIGALSISFRDMTQALGDRLDTIEKFAGDVSHELKNPLSSMRSAVETLSKKIQTSAKDDPNTDKLLKVILHDVERMNRLISDISKTSRLDVALEREGRSVVDLIALMRDIIEVQTQIHPQTQIHLKRAGDYDFSMRGNADKLAQVFQNLIDNAASFMDQKGKVTVHFDKDRDWIVMHIEDQGPGIPPDKVDAIFDRFYSERPGHEDYGNHSGLGLAIAKQIVEAHRGDIRAENINDKGVINGARFIVRLPGA